MPTPHKNKTFTTFLALGFGAIGVHRFYLRGAYDRLGILHVCAIPIMGMVYGAGRAPNVFWVLLPLLVSAIIGFVEALVIGLTPDDKWDARHNAASDRSSQTSWIVALLLVLTMLVGTTTLIATLARLFDLAYSGGAYG
jgi:uncharacterized membrane protein